MMKAVKLMCKLLVFSRLVVNVLDALAWDGTLPLLVDDIPMSVVQTYSQDDERLSIIQESGSIVLKVGERRAIFCKGSEPGKEWLDVKKNVVGKRNTTLRVHVEPDAQSQLVLMFNDANLSDNGTWTCRAGDLERTIDIIIVEEASFETTGEYEMPTEGRDQVLQCVAHGIPPPTLIWYRDGEPIPVDSQPEKYRSYEDGRLVIRKVNRFDSGEYECKALQKQGSVYFHIVSTMRMLQVKHAPMMEHDTVQDLFAIINETKTLRCAATAYPKPTYKWTRTNTASFDSAIVQDDKFSIFTDEDGTYSELTMKIESEKDLGEFVCIVNNAKGHNKTTYHLSQGNKPQALEMVEFVSATNTSLVFRVTCGNCTPPIDTAATSPDPENLPVTAYRFELLNSTAPDPIDWKAEEEQVIVVTLNRLENQTDYIVEGLQPLTTYKVRVAAENLAGFSEFIEITAQSTVALGTMLTSTRVLISTLVLALLSHEVLRS